jgi:hypothetical protein
MMNPSIPPSVPLSDLESRARERLSPEVYGYYAGAAGAEATLAANSRRSTACGSDRLC